ncbi:uncharacterized protein LOC117316619 [Pecten maximus]|uniref:uncharacterized protein LOC117316619 n=1 Tax=Pecten maximus TaxID=6579 RepID=UPI001457EE0E|nr:uncharacterized protein LOC117316619 [Pecten maximus]
MKVLIAVVCLLALVYAEDCIDSAECHKTHCDPDASVACENQKCTCNDNHSTVIAGHHSDLIDGLTACFSVTDCAGPCMPVVPPTTTAPHHHHGHPDPHHEELEPHHYGTSRGAPPWSSRGTHSTTSHEANALCRRDVQVSYSLICQ